MKKIILLFTLFFSLFANAQTSVYKPFPGINSFWTLGESFYCWTGVPSGVGTGYSIKVSTDTVISSATYHKLIIPYLKWDSTNCTFASITTNIYRGCIREDTVAKKVFYVYPTLTTEKLLYDFNLQVGDTVLGVLETFWPKDTVISIDSVQTAGAGGGWHKRWFINSCYNIYVIEGVGSTYGLIEDSPGCGPDNTWRELYCMNASTYIYPAISDCDAITSMPESIKETTLQIFPNPSFGKFQLALDNKVLKQKPVLMIYNAFGQLILKQELSTTEIDLSPSPKGIYFIKIQTGENNYSGKVVIE